MFMIALGFIIFSGCTLNLVVDFVKTLAKSAMGGDNGGVIDDAQLPMRYEIDYVRCFRKRDSR